MMWLLVLYNKLMSQLVVCQLGEMPELEVISHSHIELFSIVFRQNMLQLQVKIILINQMFVISYLIYIYLRCSNIFHTELYFLAHKHMHARTLSHTHEQTHTHIDSMTQLYMTLSSRARRARLCHQMLRNFLCARF